MSSGPTPVYHQAAVPAISYANQASNLSKISNLQIDPRIQAKKAAQAEAEKKKRAEAEKKKIEEEKRAKKEQEKLAREAAKAKAQVNVQEEQPEYVHIPLPVIAKPKGRASGFAIVKAVLSGDTLALMGSVTDVNAPEKQVTLSGINAPKFGRGKNQTDEPFAWASREYLRKLVIGRQIHFNVNYVSEQSGREYAVVTLDGENLAHRIVRAGWATVKGPTDPEAKVRPEQQELLDLQTEAITEKLGVHRKDVTPASQIRAIDWTPDARELFETYKNKPIPAVIDQVRDGSTVRCELIIPGQGLKHKMITLNLAGVSAPRTPLPQSVLDAQYEKKVAENPKTKEKRETVKDAEPFAMEAQNFTETRLLNRDVHVVLQAIDKTGALFGTIQFAKGNISVKLLEMGYAKLVAWSAAATPDAPKLKEAETTAKAQKLRIWQNYTPEAEKVFSADHDFTGKVIQILSGDSVLIATPSGEERKYQLASIRAPKLAPPKSEKKDEAFAQEAKELLRKQLIGHKVRVIQEYVRDAPAESNDKTPRLFATIFQNKVNVNEQLVLQGLATVIRHRMDEDRSQYYDTYLAAELNATTNQKGVHGKKEVIVQRIVDLTDRPRKSKDDEKDEKKDSHKGKATSSKAKQYLVFLQREKQIPAVVEHVFTGGKLKLFVPREHVLVAFALAGIRVDAPKNRDGTTSEIGQQAYEYVRSRLLQHSVRIEVETMDKGDNFIGSLFYGKNNLAVELLQHGLAQLVEFSANKSPYKTDLYAAEKEAKEAKRGLWENYVEPTPEEIAAKLAAANGDDEFKQNDMVENEFLSVKVTDIADATDFFIQVQGDKNIEIVEKAMATVEEIPVPEDYVPQVGSLAAGQFNDGTWHRVRIEGEDDENGFRVYFIDFGNHDVLEADKLKPLPAEVTKVGPLARPAALAGLKHPTGEDYAENAALAFSDAVWNQQLLAKVIYTDYNGIVHLVLLHESSPISINRQLLAAGHARVASRPHPKVRALLDELRAAEKEAKDAHYNIWEYGDVSDEEEAESFRSSLGRPARRK